MLYSSPYGSNDDWYWMYATVKAGVKPSAATSRLLPQDKMHTFYLIMSRQGSSEAQMVLH